MEPTGNQHGTNRERAWNQHGTKEEKFKKIKEDKRNLKNTLSPSAQKFMSILNSREKEKQ